MEFKLYSHNINKIVANSTVALLLGFGLLLILYLMTKIFDNISDSLIFSVISTISIIILFFGFLSRYLEHEKYNESPIGMLKLNTDGFVINDNCFLYNEISNLHFDIWDYFGRFQDVFGYGACLSIGLRNKISFKTDSSTYEFYFQLDSEKQIDDLQNYIFEIIMDEKIVFNGIQTPKMLSIEQKKSERYKAHIKKLMKENKIECELGIKLLGLDSYKPGIEILKRKYCS